MNLGSFKVKELEVSSLEESCKNVILKLVDNSCEIIIQNIKDTSFKVDNRYEVNMDESQDGTYFCRKISVDGYSVSFDFTSVKNTSISFNTIPRELIKEMPDVGSKYSISFD